ncbi:MAG: hypothetical protein JWQ87_4278 [Candidatus Sulfotelmatobacter sp.]|nr:hypothetical protein [Candidatus Sulfotelmatobacter sp.]
MCGELKRRNLKAVIRAEVGSVFQRRKATPVAHDFRLLRCCGGSSPVFNGWKGDSPKGFYPVVLFGKLDRVSGDSLEASQLRDDPSRELSAALISHDHSRANEQLTIQLDGGSMLIQIGGFGGHRKGTLLAIFTRQPYGSTQAHSSATALCYLTSMTACGGD